MDGENLPSWWQGVNELKKKSVETTTSKSVNEVTTIRKKIFTHRSSRLGSYLKNMRKSKWGHLPQGSGWKLQKYLSCRIWSWMLTYPLNHHPKPPIKSRLGAHPQQKKARFFPKRSAESSWHCTVLASRPRSRRMSRKSEWPEVSSSKGVTLGGGRATFGGVGNWMKVVTVDDSENMVYILYIIYI